MTTCSGVVRGFFTLTICSRGFCTRTAEGFRSFFTRTAEACMTGSGSDSSARNPSAASKEPIISASKLDESRKKSVALIDDALINILAFCWFISLIVVHVMRQH